MHMPHVNAHEILIYACESPAHSPVTNKRSPSWCRCACGVSPVPVQTWQQVSPVPVQTWQQVSPVPAQMWRNRCTPNRLLVS
jgi:gentisate 1,2-dioxygenase